MTDAGGTYSGSPFPALATVNGGSILEGVSPTVAYYAGSTPTGTPLSGAPITAGTYTVVASFAGSANYTSATSTPVTFTVAQATPTVSVTDAGGTYNGATFPAFATVDGDSSLEGVSPTVTYYAGNIASGTPLSGPPITAGTYTVVASFADSTDYGSATSTPVTFTIAQATPTVTVTDAGGTYTGSAFPATAKVNGQNSLEGVSPTFTYYAGTDTTGSPLSGAPITAGTYTVVASFLGSTDYGSATSTPATFTIAQATPTVTVMDAGGTYNGATFPATAKVNGQDSLEGISPTFTYYAGTNTASTPLSGAPLNAGTYTVVASFAGSTDYVIANSLPATFTIAQATPTVTVTDAGGTDNGSTFPATAKVNGQDSLEGVSPTNTYYTGADTTGTQLSGAPIAGGTYTVVASFAGSTDYGPATSTPVTFTIIGAAVTVTITDAGGAYNGSPFPATATVNGATSLQGVSPTVIYYVGTDTTGTQLAGAHRSQQVPTLRLAHLPAAPIMLLPPAHRLPSPLPSSHQR